MARHQASEPPPRNRDLRPVAPTVPAHRSRRPGLGRILLVLAAVVVVVAAVLVAVRLSSGSDTPAAAKPTRKTSASPSASPTSTCHPTGTALRVVVASAVADMVKAAAASDCENVDVTVDDSEAAAASLRTGRADVWIPDSRVRGYLAVGPAVAHAPSLAISPLVMAASPVAASALSQGSAATWAVLLDQAKLKPLTVAVQDPTSSGASLVLAGALAALGTAATGGNQNTGVAAAAGAIHALGKVAPGPVGTLAPTQVDVVEQRLLAGAKDVAEVPTSEGLPYLDYPFVTPPTGVAAATQAASAALLAALAGPAAVTARDDAHLLPPSDTKATLTASTASLALIPGVDVAAMPTSIAVANTSTSAVSVLAVLDVSGSMADAAPGQQAPIEVVRQSAQTFFTTFGGQGVNLGLWEFGHQLAPPSDHVQIFPIQPFASSKALLGPAIAAVQARQTGTALYNTTLDAYRTVQKSWKANSANIVVVFTDGKDQDAPNSVGLPSLLSTLKAEADPRRPVQIVFFGYGQADIAAMTSITKVVGGGVYPIASSADIVGAFIRASGQIAASAG